MLVNLAHGVKKSTFTRVINLQSECNDWKCWVSQNKTKTMHISFIIFYYIQNDYCHLILKSVKQTHELSLNQTRESVTNSVGVVTELNLTLLLKQKPYKISELARLNQYNYWPVDHIVCLVKVTYSSMVVIKLKTLKYISKTVIFICSMYVKWIDLANRNHLVYY